MPACATDNFARFVRSNSDLCSSPRAKRCPQHHAPPPFTALRRSFSSTFTLIPEECSVSPERSPAAPLLWRLVTWGPRLAFQPLLLLLNLIFHPAWRQILIVLPTLWIAACLFVFWKCVQCPIGVLRMLGRALNAGEAPRRPRTVLISGGSTVQALHLARHFHSAGARVIAFEIEGQFALLNYSAAVDRFYTVPRPNPADPLAYARALCDIVERESVVFFVPVSATTPAYYDALAKPHLELIGCQCFIPCAQDVVMLDDPLELIRLCRASGLPAPQFTVVTSEEEVRAWYDSGASQEGRHFIASAGARGARDRLRFTMPEGRGKFRLPREISTEKPWVIVREPHGDRFLTCTTLKESRAVSNVTCRLDTARRGLVPQYDEEIDLLVSKFVSRMEPQRPMTGHVSFRIVREADSGRVVTLGARVGVSLPYLCQAQGGGGGRCGHAGALRPGVAAVGKLLDTVLDTREALFAYWDPLPYCAYYRARLPDDQPAPLAPPDGCKTPPHMQL